MARQGLDLHLPVLVPAAKAVLRGARKAKGLPGVPALGDLEADAARER